MTTLLQRRRRRQALQRWIVVTVIGVFFALPFVAMVEFTTRAPSGSGRTLEVWRTLADVGRLADQYPDLLDGVEASAGLVVVTVLLMLVLLVPTMIWVRLRLPWLRRPLEFVCLLPLTVPAIVLVVGLAPVYAWVAYFLGPSSLTLCFASGKLGMTLDLQSEAGREVARDLTRWADVVVESFSPGLMRRWGLDYETQIETARWMQPFHGGRPGPENFALYETWKPASSG